MAKYNGCGLYCLVLIMCIHSCYSLCSVAMVDGAHHVNCSHRNLKEIPDDLQYNVTSINLAWNELSPKGINSTVLDRYIYVTQLILSGNRDLGFESLAQQLSNVHNVQPKKISLDYISSKPSIILTEAMFCFSFYEKVTHVTLRANQIMGFQLSFTHCVPNIQFLAVGFNHIQHVYTGVHEIPFKFNSDFLYLVKSVHLPYRMLTRLRILDASDFASFSRTYREQWKYATISELFRNEPAHHYSNDLTVLDSDETMFDNEIQIERFYIQRYIFTSAFWGGSYAIVMESLKFIDASYNPGNKEVGSTMYFPNLETFKCRSCSFIKLQIDVFTHLTKLIEIDLSSNDLGGMSSKFSEIFKPLQKLEYLNLRKNEIKHLPKDSFSSLISLKILDLSGNLLTHIDIILQSTSLTHLDIRENSLKDDFISRDTRENLTSLSRISKTLITIRLGPELACTCKAIELFEWAMHVDNMNIRISNGTTCSFKEHTVPFDKAHNLLTNATECIGLLIPVLVSSIIIGIIVLVLSVLTYRYKIYIRWIFYKVKHSTLKKHKFVNSETPPFDVYISVANEDLAWTKETILHYVEDINGMTAYLYERDSIGGESIYDNIYYGISNSASVIVVLSPHFVRDETRDWELSMAVASGKSRIALLEIGDITSLDNKLSGVLKYLILPTPKVMFYKWKLGTCNETIQFSTLIQHIQDNRV